MEDVYDVIVAGLGPAGATVARALAGRGIRVLGLDKARFPRHKPCGGCLSRKIERILEPDFRSLVERDIYGMTFCLKNGAAVHIRDHAPVAYTITRSRFDTYLVDKARRAGAKILEEETVKGFRSDGNTVEVITDRGHYRARVIVGADGANSVIARSAGLPHLGWKGVLLEGEVSIPLKRLNTLIDEVIIEFGIIPFGYGWIFPKADHLSIGVGGLHRKIGNPKPHYREFLRRHRILEDIREEKLYGHTLPVYTKRRPFSRGNCLLVGDATGLVDPFIGEGIYYAIRSGQIAAEVIASALSTTFPDLSHYDILIEKEIWSELRDARKIAKLVYALPDLFSRITAAHPELLRAYFDVLRGEQSYTFFNRKLRRRVLETFLVYAGLLRTRPREVIYTYDRIAPHYDVYSRTWQWAFKDLHRQLCGLIRKMTPSGALVLDAGGGTGATTAMILSETKAERVDLLDISRGMLQKAREKLTEGRVHFIRGDMNHLPYPEKTFDLVVSTWAIETLNDPKAAVREFLRVIKDDGAVIYLFSSRPEEGMERFGALLIEWLFGGKFAFRFLSRQERPYHHCAMSSLVTFFGGLVTLVVLRKCCTVEDEAAPCILPASWGESLRGLSSEMQI